MHSLLPSTSIATMVAVAAVAAINTYLWYERVLSRARTHTQIGTIAYQCIGKSTDRYMLS